MDPDLQVKRATVLLSLSLGLAVVGGSVEKIMKPDSLKGLFPFPITSAILGLVIILFALGMIAKGARNR